LPLHYGRAGKPRPYAKLCAGAAHVNPEFAPVVWSLSSGTIRSGRAALASRRVPGARLGGQNWPAGRLIARKIAMARCGSPVPGQLSLVI